MGRCGLAIALIGLLAALAPAEQPARRVTHSASVRLERLLEFELQLRRLPAGRRYLFDPVRDREGENVRRLERLRRLRAVPVEALQRLVRDKDREAAVRAVGLRLLVPGKTGLDRDLAENLLVHGDRLLRLETIRTLQLGPVPGLASPLRAIAGDETEETTLRAEAVAALAHHVAQDQNVREALLQLTTSAAPPLQKEALRSLRGLADTHEEVQRTLLQLAERLRFDGRQPSERERELAAQLVLALGGGGSQGAPSRVRSIAGQARPTRPDAWYSVKSGGDPASGRRVFFHPNGPGCYLCHAVDGRGRSLGPNLSQIGRAMSRRDLIEAIVAPSRAIAPPFVTWSLATDAGRVYSGMIVDETDRQVLLATQEGEIVTLDRADISDRARQRVSPMPRDLVNGLTVAEFRDLLAFLQSRK